MTAAGAGTDPERLTRYLLGELPGEEEAEIDAALLADTTMWDTVRRAEDELIDAYVLGRIDRDRRVRVAERVASSPRLQQRVVFARNLHEVARAQPVARPAPWMSRAREWLATRTARIALVGVAVAALVLAIVWPRGGDPAPVVASLMLEPATRAPSIATVVIRAAGVVEVTAVLDPEEVSPRYRVRVLGARGEVWSIDGVSGAASSVRVQVPTRELGPGAYELEVTGLRGNGEAVPLGNRLFRVTATP